MTDYTKMVERLREIASVQGFPTDDLVDAADAIEALAADRDQLQRDFTYMKQQRDALQAKCAGLEHVKNAFELQMLTLQAKLDELQRQEPVAHQFQTEIDKKWHNFIDDEHYHHTVDDGRWPIRALYAAPKALEPLTAKEDWDIRGILASKLRVFHRATEAEVDELISLFAYMKSRTPLTQPEVVEAFCNTRHNTQYVSVFDAGVRFAEKHHGITKGTP